MNYMAEYLLGNLTHENRMILAQYVFIITLVYLVVIIIILWIGQKTRNLIPSKQSKIKLPQQVENETLIWKVKTGTVPGISVNAGKKQNLNYQGVVPSSARQPVNHSDYKRCAG
jgi:cbb3-type cytochrome oxidase subunit 3